MATNRSDTFRNESIRLGGIPVTLSAVDAPADQECRAISWPNGYHSPDDASHLHLLRHMTHTRSPLKNCARNTKKGNEIIRGRHEKSKVPWL